jgi:hypothetical protein
MSSTNVTSLSASCFLIWTQQKISYTFGGRGGYSSHTFLTSALDEGKLSPSQPSHFGPTEYNPSALTEQEVQWLLHDFFFVGCHNDSTNLEHLIVIAT